MSLSEQNAATVQAHGTIAEGLRNRKVLGELDTQRPLRTNLLDTSHAAGAKDSSDSPRSSTPKMMSDLPSDTLSSHDEPYVPHPEDAQLEEGDKKATFRKRFSFICLAILVLPAFVYPMINVFASFRNSVILVEADNVNKVEEIFFKARGSWLVSCVKKRKKGPPTPKPLLQEASSMLKSLNIKTAQMYCWEPLVTEKSTLSIADRFGLPKAPPLVLATAGIDRPRIVIAKNLTATELAARTWAAIEHQKRDVIQKRNEAREQMQQRAQQDSAPPKVEAKGWHEKVYERPQPSSRGTAWSRNQHWASYDDDGKNDDDDDEGEVVDLD